MHLPRKTFIRRPVLKVRSIIKKGGLFRSSTHTEENVSISYQSVMKLLLVSVVNSHKHIIGIRGEIYGGRVGGVQCSCCDWIWGLMSKDNSIVSIEQEVS